MADIEKRIYLEQTADGTAFSGANEAGAAVRLRSSNVAGTDLGEYTGNVATSGDFADETYGYWSIGIDEEDSGYFRVEWYTTATGVWAAVGGFAPIKIDLEPYLPLDGGTMTGDIAMGEKDITGVKDIEFADDAVGTIGGITSEDLLDKSAAETVTGDWAHTGEVDITKDKLMIGGVAVTATAAEVNMLDGLTTTDSLMTLQGGVSANTRSAATGATVTLTASESGYIPIDTSSNNVTIVMPALSTVNVGSPFYFYLTDATNEAYITLNAADTAFALLTGSGTQTTGTQLTIDTLGGEVMLRAGAGSGALGVWLIVYGQKTTIS